MEDYRKFWHLRWSTIKIAQRKLHFSDNHSKAQQSHQLNAGFPQIHKEPKRGSQTAQQQAAKCCSTHQRGKRVVSLSIKTHFCRFATWFCWISHPQEHAAMSMQTFLQEGGPRTTPEIHCPFLDELLYHRHPGHLTCMVTSLDCQQSKAGGAVNNFSKVHNQLLPALIFSIATVPAVQAASLHPSCQLTGPADSSKSKL